MVAIAYDRAAVLLPPVTGVKGVVAVLMVRVVAGIDWVAVTAVFTVRLKVLVAVALLESVTVTV